MVKIEDLIDNSDLTVLNKNPLSNFVFRAKEEKQERIKVRNLIQEIMEKDEEFWEFERSSGYAGYRNKKTGEWIYKEDYFRRQKTKTVEEELLEQINIIYKINMKTTINIEGKEFTIEQLKELINKNEDKLEKVFNFNKTTEEQFNKKWEGFEEHEKYGALERLIVNFYNKGEKPNWENTKQYKYYPCFIMDKGDFHYYFYYYYYSFSSASSRLAFLRKEDMLEAVELYLDTYKKSRL